MVVRKGTDSVISLRLPADEAARLQDEADTKGTTISKVARRALTAGLRPIPTPPLSYGIASPGSSLSIATRGSADFTHVVRTTGSASGSDWTARSGSSS